MLQLPIGAESVGIGADDLEELEEDEEEYLRLGRDNEHEADFSKLQLKPDHHNRHACKAVSINICTSNPCTCRQFASPLPRHVPYKDL